MSEDSAQAKLLEQFQRIVAEHEQARAHQGEGQPDYSHSVELLNLASVGFGVASRLVPLLIAEDTRDPRQVALQLSRWERWVLRGAANGLTVLYRENIAGDEGLFRIGDTFYMGGDPNFDAKSDAAGKLKDASLLAPLPMPDMRHERMIYYRLTDFGAQVAEQLAAIEAQEEDAHAH